MEGLFLQNISAGYENKIIIKDLNVQVRSREILVIMGTSGAGKTTILKTILGIITPQNGKIILKDKDITRVPIEERNIGYLAQFYALFPHMNVAQNISYGLMIRQKSKDEQKETVGKLLNAIELSEFGDRYPQELSGGQQQRVALARAIAANPSLILLDEPLSNIDQITKFEVATFIKKMFSSLEIPMIIVTNQWEDAKFFGDNIAVLIEGTIAQIGTYNELVKNPKNPLVQKLLSPYANIT